MTGLNTRLNFCECCLLVNLDLINESFKIIGLSSCACLSSNHDKVREPLFIQKLWITQLGFSLNDHLQLHLVHLATHSIHACPIASIDNCDYEVHKDDVSNKYYRKPYNVSQGGMIWCHIVVYNSLSDCRSKNNQDVTEISSIWIG